MGLQKFSSPLWPLWPKEDRRFRAFSANFAPNRIVVNLGWFNLFSVMDSKLNSISREKKHFGSNHSNLLLVIYSTRVKKEQKRGNRLTLEFNPVFVPIAQNLGRTVKESLALDFTLVLLTNSEYHWPLSVYFFPPCLLPLLIDQRESILRDPRVR